MKPTDELTPEALRREIATLRGVTCIQISTVWEEYADVGPVEIEVWRDQNYTLIPDWPNDPVAALELMSIGCVLARVDPEIWPGKWECTNNSTQNLVTEYADTAAMAMARWYYATAQRERGEGESI